MEADLCPGIQSAGWHCSGLLWYSDRKHAIFVLSLGAGGQADGLHLCFHVTEAVTLRLWRSLGVYSFPGHHQWLGRVGCAFLLWLSMSSIPLSPQNPDWALVVFLACVGASWLLGHHSKAPSDLGGIPVLPVEGFKGHLECCLSRPLSPSSTTPQARESRCTWGNIHSEPRSHTLSGYEAAVPLLLMATRSLSSVGPGREEGTPLTPGCCHHTNC